MKLIWHLDELPVRKQHTHVAYLFWVRLIVKCHYNTVRYNMILLSLLHWLKQNINQTLNWQKTPHTSPSRASYRVSIVRIWEKIDCVITAPHCKHRIADLTRGIIDVQGDSYLISLSQRETVVVNGTKSKHQYFSQRMFENINKFIVPLNALNVTFLLWISHQAFLTIHVQLLPNNYSTDHLE